MNGSEEIRIFLEVLPLISVAMGITCSDLRFQYGLWLYIGSLHFLLALKF